MSEKFSKQPKHGLGRYKKQKCRCDICMEANRLYCEQRRERNHAARTRNKIDATPLIDLLYKDVETHSSLGRKLRRWRYQGVDIYTADKLCCEMGYHPYEVFGDAWWKGAFEDVEQG
jgi:hypothetical protein